MTDEKYVCAKCGKDKEPTLHLYDMGFCKFCKEFTRTKIKVEGK